MKVPIDELWIEPCTLLVERESAVTLPATCSRGALSCTRSAKLVSVRLKAVVCEFAMLPEIFCSAKDCACRPVTAVVNASKTPIPILHAEGRLSRRTSHGSDRSRRFVASPVPQRMRRDFNELCERPGARDRFRPA